MQSAEGWAGIKAIGMVVSDVCRDGEKQSHKRYYILSKFLSGEKFAQAVRGHWGIENNLHWQLDVTFREDHSCIRKQHADVNFSILRRTALALLKNENTAKIGIKNKRLKAGWDNTYLMKLLTQT